jgi:DNA modification methylase
MIGLSRSADYDAFLASKVKTMPDSGFQCDRETMPSAHLFDFQAEIVRWACKKGKAAVFADTGLGKTRIQLFWADLVARHTGGNVLILAPLAVGPQTVEEAGRIGIGAVFAQSQEHAGRITVANYDSLHKFDASRYAGVVLDESSILKSFMGKIKRQLIESFIGTPYKLACTATPAPNDYLELGNHADFLGVMASSEMISRWFLNDTMVAGGYALKEHGRKDFWRWVASWAICVSNPADIGFDGSRYILPPLNIREHIVSTEGLPPVEGQLFRDTAMSATSIHKEMRLTAPERARRVAELAKDGTGPLLVWINTDYEAVELRKVMEFVEVKGSDSPEVKTERLLGFAHGEIPVLVTKPSIAGFGMNFQLSHRMIFMGMSYSYEAFYQSIRRQWRFGQSMPVKVDIVIADSEGGILQTVRSKQVEHERMKADMQISMDEVMEIGSGARALTLLGDHAEETGEEWRLVNDDCVKALSREPDNSIGYSVFSPPFSTLYIYSDSIADMGNTADDSEFFAQFVFALKEIERTLIPGRLASIHCKDLPAYMGRDSYAGLVDFPGKIIAACESVWLRFHSRVTIWKDPVIEMQRTKNHGLLYKELCKDSTVSRQGMADYIITVRKWRGIEEKEPVNSGHSERFFDYRGCTKIPEHEYSRGLTPEERKRLYSIAVWQRYASPVWFDINQTDVLNKVLARAQDDERHICPLQLGVIERCIELWSNPGDVVMSPFAGIGSEGYQAIKQGRKFLGIELKKSYFDIAARHLRMAVAESGQHGLFGPE